MADSRPLDALLPDGESSDRDSRVEALLVEGLDRYFMGQYEDAIHLWTRVLFLDRPQARARAYIDRARSALAERQRRSEEMLQISETLIEQGRAAEARHLLRQVEAAGGDDERASAVRVKLERFERASVGAPRIRAAEPMEPAVAVWSWLNRRVTVRMWVTMACSVLVVVAASSAGVRGRLGLPTAADSLVIPAVQAVVPVLSTAEVGLVRARALFARGRLAEALLALDHVGVESAVRPDADRLRVDIQRLLLAASTERPSASRTGERGPE